MHESIPVEDSLFFVPTVEQDGINRGSHKGRKAQIQLIAFQHCINILL